MAAVRNLFTTFDFPKSDWRRLQRTDFVRSGVENISTPRRTKFVRRDQWFYVISHLFNRSYGRFERTIKWRSALSNVRATLRLQLAYSYISCVLPWYQNTSSVNELVFSSFFSCFTNIKHWKTSGNATTRFLFIFTELIYLKD